MSAAKPMTVVKVGGSFVSDAPRLRAVLAALAESAEGPTVIVPGGGPFADAVRVSQGALGFSDALAHRLALDAMSRMAEVFAEIEPRLAIVYGLEGAAAARGGTCLWDPVVLRAGHPGIPESWDVTSDSLALWLATRLSAMRCVLLKSTACPAGATPDELARSGLVDGAFPDFARAFRGEIVLCGPEAFSDRYPLSKMPGVGLEDRFQTFHGLPTSSFAARLPLAPRDESGVEDLSPASEDAAA